MYLGRYQQGDELPLELQCVDASDSPANPTTLPVAKVYLDGSTPTLVESFQMAADLRTVVAGQFRVPRFLGNLYGTAGRYLVTMSYLDSGGVGRVVVASFVLNPGGHADGSVIAMKFVDRPDARFLLYQTDAGRMVRGRNPR